VSDHHPPKRWEVWFYAAVRALLLALCKVWFRLSVEGKERIPAEQPFVLAPVHRSNLDFLLVSVVTGRRLRYMGKDSLWKNATFGKLISALGAFPVHRGTADREALRRCMEIIDAGEPLVMFPEGTRQHGPEVQELFDGPVYVAARTGVPVVPVGIGGSEKAMPKGSKMIWPRKIHVIVGDPMPVERSGDRASRRELREATARLHTEVQRLFDAAQSAVGAPNA
jgi:1-acyl-sn-glycerol-3-phosphate acyltransferase